MAGRDDHLVWADEHEAAAEATYASSDHVMRRWSVVFAYYNLLHIAHAVAADRWNEHPERHHEVFQIPTRIDPNRTQLEAQLLQSLEYSQAARYLRDPGSTAAQWFDPYKHSADELIDEAITIMRTVGPELRRIAGLP